MKLNRLVSLFLSLAVVVSPGVSRAQNLFNLPAASSSARKSCDLPTSYTESDLGFSRNVAGTLTNIISGLAGCAQAICTTNKIATVTCSNAYVTALVWTTNQVLQLSNCSTTWVNYVACQTNYLPCNVCTTNKTTHVITCTNKPIVVVVCQTNRYVQAIHCQTNWVPVVHCQSNTVRQTFSVTNFTTHVTCTNNYNGAAIYRLSQHLSGPIGANASCDELATYIPATATFEALFSTSVRQPDWRGYHTGTFTIHNGTNVFATGSLYGDNGVDAHGAVEPCASCRHLEGALSGTLTKLSGLPGARLQATYAGDIAGPAGCASNAPPQGTVTLYMDGVAITTNCIARGNNGGGSVCGGCLNTYQLDFDWSVIASDQGGGCTAPGTSTGHCSLPVTSNAGCIWISANNPASGMAGGVQYITGAEVYPDIDMGNGTYYFGVQIGTLCVMIPNTDTVNPSACPTGAYQAAQTSGCSAGSCVYSFSIANIVVH